MSSQAYSVAESCTYTEARARYVLGKVYDELLCLVTRQLLPMDTARRWKDDLLYLLGEQAIRHFEIQCHLPSGRACGLRYEVDDTGDVVQDDDSGDIDAYALPRSTALSLVVNLRPDYPDRAAVWRELGRRGWGAGELLDGQGTRDHTYSRGGFGLIRSRVGQWGDEE